MLSLDHVARAVLYFEEEVYHKTDEREAAWHFFEPVTVDLGDRTESFLTNISVIDYTHGGERLFSLELTIENPISGAEFTAAPHNGRHSLRANEVSGVRVAAFNSFVKKEKGKIERDARAAGLIPWRVDESAVNELRRLGAKTRKMIAKILDKYNGEEPDSKKHSRDAKSLYDLRKELAEREADVAAEYKPEGMEGVKQPIAPNGKPSRLSVDAWLTVRTKAFKTWFGDWENDPAEMREAVANIETVLNGKLDKGFRYRDLSAEEIAFFKELTGVDFEGYEWRIIPRALLHENRRAERGLEWNLTDTELELLPYFIDSILDNKETLAVSLGEVNAKGVRSFMVEVENPITKARMVFEASSKKHKRRPFKTKEAPRLSLSSAKMLLIQRAGLAPASTPKSVPSGEATMAENRGEVKQNLLKQEFSSRDTSINSNRTPAVYGMVDKIGGWRIYCER